MCKTSVHLLVSITYATHNKDFLGHKERAKMLILIFNAYVLQRNDSELIKIDGNDKILLSCNTNNLIKVSR